MCPAWWRLIFHLIIEGVAEACTSATIGILCIRFTALEIMGVYDSSKIVLCFIRSPVERNLTPWW